MMSGRVTRSFELHSGVVIWCYGVGRPAGETLYFGRFAAAVLEYSQHSILLVSS